MFGHCPYLTPSVIFGAGPTTLARLRLAGQADLDLQKIEEVIRVILGRDTTT